MNRNGTTATAPVKSEKPKTLKDFILGQKNLIQTALPKSMDGERFARMVTMNIHQNPTLGNCEPYSVLAAAIQSAQMGLEPGGPLGEAFLIPYQTKKGWMCQFQMGYKGLLKLAHNTKNIRDIQANPVHRNDEFSFAYGSNSHLNHTPALEHRGDPFAYYACCNTIDGGFYFHVMSISDVEEHRDKYSKAPNSPAWKNSFHAMALKTCLIKMLKLVPKSAELAKQIATDGTVKHEIAPNMVDIDTDEIVFQPFTEDDDVAVESRDDTEH